MYNYSWETSTLVMLAVSSQRFNSAHCGIFNYNSYCITGIILMEFSFFPQEIHTLRGFIYKKQKCLYIAVNIYISTSYYLYNSTLQTQPFSQNYYFVLFTHKNFPAFSRMNIILFVQFFQTNLIQYTGMIIALHKENIIGI